MARKQPMPEAERAVCGRLRRFRLALGLTQGEFARRAGLHPRLYASYEYARSCLNYPAARRILEAYRSLSASWLATGWGIPFEMVFAVYPPPLAFGPRTLFTAVYAKALEPLLAKGPKLWALQPGAELPKTGFAADAAGRTAALDTLEAILLDFFAALPDRDFPASVDALLGQIVSLFLPLPHDRGEARKLRLEQLLRADARRRRVLGPKLSQQTVDTSGGAAYKDGVISQTPSYGQLIEALKHTLSQPGSKAALARQMRVSRQAVHRWLSGDAKPSAEMVLRLLKWIWAAEDQPKGSSRAPARPRPKIHLP